MFQFIKTAFKAEYIRDLISLAFVLTIGLPMLSAGIISPLYKEMTLSWTENDAEHLATHLVSQYFEDRFPIYVAKNSDDDIRRIIKIQEDFRLHKIRIFSPEARIVFSSDPEEVGKVNDAPYFRSQVAKGRIFSKLVKKNTNSLEGDNIPLDVVEVYVPVIREGIFKGAFEIYYDLTGRFATLSSLTWKINAWLMGIAFLIVIIILLTAAQAGKLFMEKETAEKVILEQAKLSAVLETAGAVCHEFNQPLQVITGYCELLKENECLDSEAIAMIDLVNGQVDKINALNLQLMGITRYETKPYVNSKIIDLKKSSQPKTQS